MPNLSPAERSELSAIAEDTFYETCTIHSATTSQSTFADTKKSYVDIEDVPCGFVSGPEMQNERQSNQLVTLDVDAILRLSLDQDIKEIDEVTCRGRRFQVDGIVVGLTVKIVNLKRAKTGNA